MTAARHATQYLRRRQPGAPWVAPLPAAPAAGLGLVVVIPARAEASLVPTVESLARCVRPARPVEVIVVLNAAADDPPGVHRLNQRARAELEVWRTAGGGAGLGLHTMMLDRLPARVAGVGMARRLGMDEALRRLVAAGAPGGVIVSLDADCEVSRGYLAAIDAHFAAGEAAAATVYFEHRPSGDASIDRAVVDYELFLRYYVCGLKLAGAPLAVHTLGSCFAVRAGAYAAAGGMNRRPAGEDFYFLNKVAQRHRIDEIRTACVWPAARLSHRTPFGTGPALARRTAAGGTLPAYDPRVFGELARLYRHFCGAAPAAGACGGAVGAYLETIGWREKVREIEANVASHPAFVKRFRVWFDGFRVLRCIHWLSRTHYPRTDLATAAAALLDRLDPGRVADTREGDGADRAVLLLQAYRAFERSGATAAAWCDPR